MGCPVRGVFLGQREQREGVETTDRQVQREVRGKWEKEDSRVLPGLLDPQEKLVVLVTRDLLELLEKQELRE